MKSKWIERGILFLLSSFYSKPSQNLLKESVKNNTRVPRILFLTRLNKDWKKKDRGLYREMHYGIRRAREKSDAEKVTVDAKFV